MSLDPFDGHPLRYRQGAGEVAVYSVGVDGRDDGAANLPGNSAEPDIVVRVSAVKRSEP